MGREIQKENGPTGKKTKLTWREKEKWVAKADPEAEWPKSQSPIEESRLIFSNPMQGEPSGTKLCEKGLPENNDLVSAINQNGCLGQMVNIETESFGADGNTSEQLLLTDREEEDTLPVFSTLKAFAKEECLLIEEFSEVLDEEELGIVPVEEDVQALASVSLPEIEEILQLSLENIKVVHDKVQGCSQWVFRNMQKFSKLMGISLEGMGNLSYLFFRKLKKER